MTAIPLANDAWNRAAVCSRFFARSLLAVARLGRARALASLTIACLAPAGVLAHGGFDERIESIERAISAEPTDPQPRLVRAELHRRHGDFAAALRDLDDVGLFSPALSRIDYFRGLVYLDSGRHAEAEAVLRRFLQREPDHSAGLLARARALLKLQRPLAAAREFDLVIEHEPVPIPDHYLERAGALAAAGDVHLAEAIRGLDQGIAVIGPIVTLERVAVDLELRSGRADAALARLERITERSPRRETWLAQRGEILVRIGRTDEARQSFALALAELDRLSSPRRAAPAMSHLAAKIRSSMAALVSRQRRGTP